jgi:hypothetical protein
MGRNVSLNLHLGFKGGLKYGVDGTETMYFANTEYEIIYHIATKMPQKPED